MNIKKVYDVECFADNKNVTDNSTYNGTISLKLDIDCEAILLYPNGVNKSVGKVEWTQVILKINIIQTNGTIFSVLLFSANVTTQYVNANYMGRFKSNPWMINTALTFLFDFLNEDFL